MSLIRFTKMHGAGNDFVVLDCINQSISMNSELARRIADRHRGIGCDQLLLVERSPVEEADFRYRIFNADGGEVEQCGNGARCFVRFVLDKGLTTRTEIRALTKGGIISPRLEGDGQVTVDMGAPVFDPSRVPFEADALVPIDTGDPAGDRALAAWPLRLETHSVAVHVLSMGNPHAVQFVEDVDQAPVQRDGPQIERHSRFPLRVNAGFAQIIDRGRVRLRVFERGVGETLACGTGACAAVVAGILRGRLDERVRVSTRGGELTITWNGKDNPVFMTGPAMTVFEGEVDPKALG